ncbi:hypothetical protein A6E15_08290 [Natrinema saccharevitans]|uniref:PadR family transcriptional regulator n=1 Tax=Natrinema saccharevitans TaxID=301967 RepID=A0A1S8AW32_9EURY|nr:hypothetical protein [Natrinema saccharevitans]OLZ40990.1 hypothetical protein A6E15_08290 [Natrinema saccharevitans]
MHDDDSRGLESPDSATALPDDHDASRRWIQCTALQRDCLEALVRLERTRTPNPIDAIAGELERRYPSVSRARLERNLRALVGRGLLDTCERAYRLTDAGRALIIQRAERLAAACDLTVVARGADR